MASDNKPKGFIDYTGFKSGKVTVLGFNGWHVQPSGQRKSRWDAICDCGKEFVVMGYNLKGKTPTTSCGCVRNQKIADFNRTHGMTESRTYKTWLSMKERCTNPNSPSYHEYGGLGVRVCDRWLYSFENFFEDMGERPNGMSLNRIGGAPIYSKETCEWANQSIQGYDQKVRNTNTSGRTGVTWNDKRGVWEARITKDYHQIYLGCSSSFEKACELRTTGELEYFGFTKQ